ncbi:MAG: alpha/beta hydrolase [Acidimicrobiales bacterium]|nr:MAG: alpha/beta hydrolase [Acidimicrobiales bacterium]
MQWSANRNPKCHGLGMAVLGRRFPCCEQLSGWHTSMRGTLSRSYEPHIAEWLPRSVTTPSGLVILLHGGVPRSSQLVRRTRQVYLRMLLFARALHRAGRKRGLVVWLLRNRVRGWNEPELDAVLDAQWALAQAAARFPGLPVVLVGHSMGGRTALRVAGAPAIVAVAALAPWTPQEEPVIQLAGRAVLVAHGDRDRIVRPEVSYRYSIDAMRATDRICRFVVSGDGHAMLRRAADWTALLEGFVLSQLGLQPENKVLTEALTLSSLRNLNIPLPSL